MVKARLFGRSLGCRALRAAPVRAVVGAGLAVGLAVGGGLPALAADVSPTGGLLAVYDDPGVGPDASGAVDGVSLPAPVVVVAPEGAWLTSGWVEASWTVEGPVEIAGWAVGVDEDPHTDPGVEVTQDEPGWGSWLDDGVHWLHVRAIGVDESVGAVAHVPLAVDTVAPVVSGLVSSSHPVGEVSQDSSVDLAWDAPADLSGVVGYQVVVGDVSTLGPEAGEVTTTLEHATVEVPSDGVGFVSVRAVDAAGWWGPFVQYEVMVDARAPGPVAVSGTHEANVATSQRHLVLSFAAEVGDDVATWVATVDHSPTASLDVAQARPEPRLAAMLEPGQWWVHVAGVDSAGRLGTVTDIAVVITEPDYAIDLATGTHLWGPTALSIVCPPTMTTATVEAIGPEGARTTVGPLVAGEGTCSVQWDPALEDAGTRVWPDGDYQLVVVRDDVELSEPVPVTVQVGADTVGRINADYAAGTITATEQAELLILSLGDPASIPEHYAAPVPTSVPTAATLLAALNATGEIPPSLVDLLTPPAPDAAPASGVQARTSGASEALAVADYTNGCVPGRSYMGIAVNCVATSEHFAVFYPPGLRVPGAPVDDLPEEVVLTLTSLERARTVYTGQGFTAPDSTYVILNPWQTPGDGVSLPGMTLFPGVTLPGTILMSPEDLNAYLPHHEYFHQVQYTYMPTGQIAAGRLINTRDIYWWTEATAEWGAHLVQTQDSSFTATSLYAEDLDTFMDNSAQRIDTGSVLSRGGPEYGAFPVAEYLQQNYGVSAIESTWQKIGSLFPPRTAALAIASVIADNGDSYAEQIHTFRQWMYPLGAVEGRGGFTTEDAQPDNFWRDQINGNSVRVPHASVTMGASTRQASGTALVGPSGAVYVEFTGPTDLAGQLSVSVSGGVKATLIGQVGTFPALCPRVNSRSLQPNATSVVQDTIALGSAYGSGCENAVLVITNPTIPLPSQDTQPDAGMVEVTWSAQFVPDGVTLDSGTQTVGVHNTGALGYGGDLVRDDTYNVQLADGWGLSDASTAGSSFGSYFYDTDDTNVQVGAFTFNANRSTAHTYSHVGPTSLLGASLVVTQDLHPSTDPNLFAVDVTVARTDPWPLPAPVSTGHVYYRRSAEWDVTWSSWVAQMTSTWARSAGGDDARVAALTDRYTPYGPPSQPLSYSTGYGTSGPLWDAGSTLDLDLGVIAAGESVSFTLYYGVATTKEAAEAAVAAVDADVFYLVYPSVLNQPQQSATGVFAYKATTS